MPYLRTAKQRANIDKLIADIESGAVTLIANRYFGDKEDPDGFGIVPDFTQCCVVGLICKHLDYTDIPWRYNDEEVSSIFTEDKPIMEKMKRMYGFDVHALAQLQSINDNHNFDNEERKRRVIKELRKFRDTTVEGVQEHVAEH
jgi:hypothetical protein